MFKFIKHFAFTSCEAVGGGRTVAKSVSLHECCGSGSVSQRYGSGSFYHQEKIVRRTWIPTVLRLLFILKNDENVSSKSNTESKKT
jgi:hypothetical protein